MCESVSVNMRTIALHTPYGQSSSMKLLKVLANQMQRYSGEFLGHSRVLHLVQEVSDLRQDLQIKPAKWEI